LNQILSNSIYPKITLVTPSFNQAIYLEQTILSVIGQNYPNLEYCIIDGGSHDGSIEIIKRYSKYITWWISEVDRGQSDAINKGFQQSTGDILGWLNSDDILFPNALFHIANKFGDQKLPKIELLYGASLYLNESDGTGRIIVPPNYEKDTLKYTNYVIQSSAFWTRELWEKTGQLNIDYKYTMDWDWFIRATSFCDFEKTNICLSVMRFHNKQKTTLARINSGNKQEMRNETCDIIKKYGGEKVNKIYFEVLARENLFSKRKNFKQLLNKLRIPYSDFISRIIFYSLYKLEIKYSFKVIRKCAGMMLIEQ
jgi:glycosyltransferase involved in cell wall biosynthesis